MRSSTKLGVFALGLLAVFVAATGLGMAVGPVGGTGPAEPSGGHSDEAPHSEAGGHSDEAPHSGAGGHGTAVESIPGGLMVSQDGYRLDLTTPRLPAAGDARLALRILAPDGRPVTRYTTAHGKELHLIAVRRDLTGFQHVHPQRNATGTWSVPLNTSVPGTYRVFADFVPEGRADGLTLGADLMVPGEANPRPFPAASRSSSIDGYDVELDGDLVAGTDSKLTLTVTRDGTPVTDLDPYLEAYGHLVALREGDLAYLHVHPAGHPGDGVTKPGPTIEFYANIPSPGRYRLFLDFSHGGVVRTADFTVTAS